MEIKMTKIEITDNLAAYQTPAAYLATDDVPQTAAEQAVVAQEMEELYRAFCKDIKAMSREHMELVQTALKNLHQSAYSYTIKKKETYDWTVLSLSGNIGTVAGKVIGAGLKLTGAGAAGDAAMAIGSGIESLMPLSSQAKDGQRVGYDYFQQSSQSQIQDYEKKVQTDKDNYQQAKQEETKIYSDLFSLAQSMFSGN